MRRINPVSHVAAAAVLLVFLFEVFFLSGVLGTEAETVRQHAPWAYEYFLRLTGEDLSSEPYPAVIQVKKPEEKRQIKSTVEQVAGLLLQEQSEADLREKPACADSAMEEQVSQFSKPETPVLPVDTNPIASISEGAEVKPDGRTNEEKTVEEMIGEEKTVEERLQEQLRQLPEIPREPDKPAAKTNNVPRKIDEDDGEAVG